MHGFTPALPTNQEAARLIILPGKPINPVASQSDRLECRDEFKTAAIVPTFRSSAKNQPGAWAPG
jgi:hypothetical protein